MGSVRGVVLAALLLAFLQSVILQELDLWVNALGRAVGSPFLQKVQLITALELIFGLILVLMMLFRREGLWPAMRRVAALTREQQTAAAGPRGGGRALVGHAEGEPGRRSRPLLEIEGLTKRFGGVAAADNTSLEVRRGELVSVIGPNGSGKTTLFNLITGLDCRGTRARSGSRARRSAGCRPTRSSSAAWPARSRTSGCSTT